MSEPWHGLDIIGIMLWFYLNGGGNDTAVAIPRYLIKDAADEIASLRGRLITAEDELRELEVEYE